mgnify:CR=1 FL=1
MGKRIEYIDFIKGICIFIVVWGHSIQNMGDGNDFWTNPVHEFICSFHMPIFMLVSGFFFSKSIGKPLIPNVTRRFKQLIIPCFGWSLVLVAINIGYMLYEGMIPSPTGTLKSLFIETFTRFWFLRSVFICFTLAIVSMKYSKRYSRFRHLASVFPRIAGQRTSAPRQVYVSILLDGVFYAQIYRCNHETPGKTTGRFTPRFRCTPPFLSERRLYLHHRNEYVRLSGRKVRLLSAMGKIADHLLSLFDRFRRKPVYLLATATYLSSAFPCNRKSGHIYTWHLYHTYLD